MPLVSISLMLGFMSCWSSAMKSVFTTMHSVMKRSVKGSKITIDMYSAALT